MLERVEDLESFLESPKSGSKFLLFSLPPWSPSCSTPLYVPKLCLHGAWRGASGVTAS